MSSRRNLKVIRVIDWVLQNPGLLSFLAVAIMLPVLGGLWLGGKQDNTLVFVVSASLLIPIAAASSLLLTIAVTSWLPKQDRDQEEGS